MNPANKLASRNNVSRLRGRDNLFIIDSRLFYVIFYFRCVYHQRSTGCCLLGKAPFFILYYTRHALNSTYLLETCLLKLQQMKYTKCLENMDLLDKFECKREYIDLYVDCRTQFFFYDFTVVTQLILEEQRS